MSRKVIKRKNEMICKTYVSHLCSHVTRTGPSTLQSAGSLPLELDIVAKTGKNTNRRREASRSRNIFVCKNEL